MNTYKTLGLVLISSLVGFLAGLLLFERFSSDATTRLDNRITEISHLENEFEASMNFYDTVEGFEYIEVLQHVENEEFQKIESLLIPKLSHRYEWALKWSTSETESENYLKTNAAFIEKIQELSKTSKLFKQIIESEEKDS